MKFKVFRPVGNASWTDEKGIKWQGFATIAHVKTVEAKTLAEAFAKARSGFDPSPILQPA